PRAATARRVLLNPGGVSAGEQAALEEGFFKGMCLPNGTHKTTSRGRLTDLDDRIGRLLPAGVDTHLLDVGISSGVTTLELIDFLEIRGHRVTGAGADIRIHARLRRFLG